MICDPVNIVLVVLDKIVCAVQPAKFNAAIILKLIWYNRIVEITLFVNMACWLIKPLDMWFDAYDRGVMK